MSIQNDATTRVRITLEEVTIELEGTQSFVESHLQKYEAKLLELMSSVPSGRSAVSIGRTKDKKEKAAKGTKKTLDIKPQAKTKSPKISAERFDIHGQGNVPSLEAFMATKNPGRSNAEKIAVIGYYIGELLGGDKFTEGQIEYAYKMLKLKRPTHLHQIMINAKNENDWFEQTEDAGVWKLTRSGEIFVSDELPKANT